MFVLFYLCTNTAVNNTYDAYYLFFQDGSFYQEGYEYTLKPIKTKAKVTKKMGKKNQKVMTNKKKYKVFKRKVSMEELYNTLDTSKCQSLLDFC